MRKYTFIAEYKGGTYISQHKANNVDESILLWAKELDFIDSGKAKLIIQKKIKDDWDKPGKISGVENVWCISFTVMRSFLLLNIIETV